MPEQKVPPAPVRIATRMLVVAIQFIHGGGDALGQGPVGGVFGLRAVQGDGHDAVGGLGQYGLFRHRGFLGVGVRGIQISSTAMRASGATNSPRASASALEAVPIWARLTMPWAMAARRNIENTR